MSGVVLDFVFDAGLVEQAAQAIADAESSPGVGPLTPVDYARVVLVVVAPVLYAAGRAEGVVEASRLHRAAVETLPPAGAVAEGPQWYAGWQRCRAEVLRVIGGEG